MMHMLDVYPQQVVRIGIQDAWQRSPVSLETCGTAMSWKQKFIEFEKRIGYRFVLRRFEYPRTVKPGRMMPMSMWWLNAGAAPVYHEYWLAVELRSESASSVERVPVDLRKWLPGDAVFDGSLYVDDKLPPGRYKIRVAILSPRTEKPAISLAIEGRQPDGWYEMGEITLEQ